MACRACYGSLPRSLVPSSLHVLGSRRSFALYPYKNLLSLLLLDVSLVCVSPPLSRNLSLFLTLLQRDHESQSANLAS